MEFYTSFKMRLLLGDDQSDAVPTMAGRVVSCDEANVANAHNSAAG